MPTLRAVVALAAFVVAAGCFPAKSPQRSLFDCRIDALRPAVDTALDAADLAREVGAKRASLSDALTAAGKSKAEADAVIAAYHACDASVDAGAQP